jgi:hypothetical protein
VCGRRLEIVLEYAMRKSQGISNVVIFFYRWSFKLLKPKIQQIFKKFLHHDAAPKHVVIKVYPNIVHLCYSMVVVDSPFKLHEAFKFSSAIF